MIDLKRVFKDILFSLSLAVVASGAVGSGVYFYRVYNKPETTPLTSSSSVSSSSASSSSAEDDDSSEVDSSTYTEDFSEFSPSLPSTLDDSSVADEEEIKIYDFLDTTADGVGWIQVPDTHIDYPVAYTGNNYFYLTHNVYKNYQYNGSPFIDYRNHSDLSDFVTAIYGHNMKDGQIFSDLDWFTNTDFFARHEWVWYLDKEYIYSLQTICCGMVADGSYLFDIFNISSDYEKERYLDNIWNEDCIVNRRADCDLSIGNNYILLVTCTDYTDGYGQYGKVFVLAKIVDKTYYRDDSSLSDSSSEN